MACKKAMVGLCGLALGLAPACASDAECDSDQELKNGECVAASSGTGGSDAGADGSGGGGTGGAAGSSGGSAGASGGAAGASDGGDCSQWP